MNQRNSEPSDAGGTTRTARTAQTARIARATRTARAGTVALGLVAALGLALSGCSLVTGGVKAVLGIGPTNPGAGGEPGASKAPTPKPTAPEVPESAWLHPGYADGLGETWTSPEDLCGIAAGVAITSAATSTSVHVSGTDLASGKQLWQRDQTHCGEASTTPDGALIAVRTAKGNGEHELTAELVDPRTGTARIASQRLTTYSGRIDLIGADESGMYVILYDKNDQKMTSIAPSGSITWSEPVRDDIITAHCLLIETVIGCESNDQAWVVDATTGETRTSFESQGFSGVSWARDGYAYQDDSGALRSAFLYSGEPVKDGSVVPTAPRMPKAEDGARIELATFFNPTAPLAVDQEGKPVLWAPDTQMEYSFTATGAPFADYELGTAYWGVTADGSAIAISPTALGDTLKIIRNDGTEVGQIDTTFSAGAGESNHPSFSGGFLVTRNAAGGDAVTTVHLPRGYK